jgi:hypothetical protein
MPNTENKTKDELIQLAKYFYPKEIFAYLDESEENQLFSYFSILSKISELESKEVEPNFIVRKLELSLQF